MCMAYLDVHGLSAMLESIADSSFCTKNCQFFYNDVLWDA